MLYLFHCTDKPGAGAVRAANRAAHLDYLKGFEDRAVLVGPLLDDSGEAMVGSCLVLDFPDRAAAQAFADNDPYAKAGLFESVVIRAMRKVLPRE